MSRSPAASVAPERRRAPQARGLATRARLLDATVACLVERGHAQTSTPEICRRAGVSQGALFKHFPTKTALLGAAVERLFEDLVADYRRAFAARPANADPAVDGVRLLWQSFRTPALQAAFELYVASRTQPELRAEVAPVLARHRRNLSSEARRLFPDAAARNPRFDAALDVLLDAMQGRMLGRAVLPDPPSEAAEIAYLARLMQRELDGGG